MNGDTNIKVNVSESEHIGHRVRAILIDKEQSVKALYCTEDCQIISYLFRKSKGWMLKSADDFVAEHKKEFERFAHLSVDQESEFLRVVGTKHDDTTQDYEPNSPSFILAEEKQLNEAPTDARQITYDTTSDGDAEKTDGKHGHGAVILDSDGNGWTDATNGHKHKVENFQIKESDDDVHKGHNHSLGEVLKDTQTSATNVVEDQKSEKGYDVSMDEEDFQIVKFDEAKRLVFGVFLWPEKADHDGDVISAEDIEKVAHGFMADYRSIDEMHNQVIEADIVESAIAWKDGLSFHGKKLSKGAWFGAIKVHDDIVWEKVKDGTYKGFSVRISGVREPIES